MQINRAYRYELLPTPTQYTLLAKSAGVARFAYNWGLAEQQKHYQETGNFFSDPDLRRRLNTIKGDQFPWMYEVSKCCAQEALINLNRALQNFFRGRKQGRKIGFPRFKKKGQRDGFKLTGSIEVRPNKVQLPRLGVVRTKERTAVEGRILSAAVSREADRWFVSFACEVEVADPQPVRGPAVAIDVGLKDFAAMWDGTEARKVQAPKPLARYLKRLKRLQRQASRKQKGGNNRRKANMKVARLHRRIRNIRQDFLHKFTTGLAKTKSAIVLEDLNVAGMMRSGTLSRAVADVGWSDMRRMLAYKCQWYGSRLILAPRFYPSSKLCSACGCKQDKMPLNIREWTCPECGTHHDRDMNAAKNLLRWAETNCLAA